MMNKSRGFTLIELLVVIAIIALLMAILMPTLARVKKQAKSITCQTLLKQWGHIWAMYCQDNDGFFCMESNTTGWPRGNWILALRHLYRTKSSILKCPMAKKRRIDLTGNIINYGGPTHAYVMGTGGYEFREEEGSYGANCWIYNPRPGDPDEIQGRPVKWNWKSYDVKGGNNIPIFGDSMWRGGGPFYQNGDPQSKKIIPSQFDGQWLGAGWEMMHFAINRHNGSINHVFMDCSVSKLGIKELWTLKWHRQFNRNGFWTKAGGAQDDDWPAWMRNFKAY